MESYKMRGALISILYTATLACLTSCFEEVIPDPIEPQIPKYTEEGLNVAGAYVNGKPWISNDNSWCIIWCSDLIRLHESSSGIWELSMDGICLDNSTSFRFVFNEASFSRATVSSLRGKKFIIDGQISQVFAGTSAVCAADYSGTGQFYLKNVEKIKNSDQYILSGSFSFESNPQSDCQLKVTYGRFDFVF